MGRVVFVIYVLSVVGLVGWLGFSVRTMWRFDLFIHPASEARFIESGGVERSDISGFGWGADDFKTASPKGRSSVTVHLG